jgi:hypothetical protein
MVSNTFTNIMYVLIWTSAVGLIDNIVSFFTTDSKKQAIIYAFILFFSLFLYKNMSSQELVLRNIHPMYLEK